MGSLKAIVAVCNDWSIGIDGKMIVENRADMKHFVRCTTGDTVIMGRRTLESLPGGSALPRRRNIVFTRDSQLSIPHVETVSSVDELMELLGDNETGWVIGGGQIYQLLLPFCDTAIVTKNHVIAPADTYFPNLDEDPAWSLVQVSEPAVVEPGEGDEGLVYQFCTYKRSNKVSFE
ncbi:dihydrofolate reductase [Collinsella sp. AGMB00827]|uniref:dihydrofolate reductase n=1 Tax=Collinsella ureilytica TaxID=2869515 RepID=A0ABS7MIE6_9ACTN|nr:dihydrofolate reductase [Collinsella urealyticum]MBY4796808.1 dihydrofolate reductase [Collinsella urealyticum]